MHITEMIIESVPAASAILWAIMQGGCGMLDAEGWMR
jgi:hypothetical protein